MPAGLAQEELKRVGRRLGGGGRRRRRRRRRLLDLARVVDDVDAARLELAEEQVDLEDVELVRLGDLGELALPDRARGLCRLEQDLEVLVVQDGLDLDRHLADGGVSAGARIETQI